MIGGDSVYQLLLPYCDLAHVTKIRHAYEADTYFANLDESGEWEITGESEEQTYFDLEYTFVRYERKKVEIFCARIKNCCIMRYMKKFISAEARFAAHTLKCM